MENIMDNIYMLAAIELIINQNTQTDLGTYVLEYSADFSEIDSGDMVTGDACLAINTRLVEKKSKSVVWGQIYYKRLIKKCDAVSQESLSKLDAMHKEILALPVEEKMKFILKPETSILKKPYAKSNLINSSSASYFGNLNGYATDGYPTVKIGGPFPKDAVSPFNRVFKETLEAANSQMKNGESASENIKF